MTRALLLTAARRVNPQAYTNKVRAIAPPNLLAYWPLADVIGSTTLTDESGNNRHGAYTAVVLGQQGVDGRRAALFDGSTSYGNVYSAGLAGAFNGGEGTVALWVRVSGAGVWTDATQRWMIGISVNANNRVLINKQVADRQILYFYAAGGTSKSVALNNVTTTGWLHIALTWSKSGDALKAYVNGAQTGATQTGLGTWAGALSATSTVLGAASTVPATVWSGLEQHVAIWDTPLSAPQIATLASG